MDENKHEVVSFGDELQALIDYGHDCCARIDDKIHECCERIKKAHDVEVGGYVMALNWKQDQLATTYDVLGNERHKAICELRKFEPMMGGRPTEEASKLIRCITGKSDSHVACVNDLEETRDTLIYLLGGDANGMDTGRCGETGAGGRVPAADKRRADCDDDQPSEGVAPVTQELRDYLEAYRPVETDTCMEVARIGTLGYQGIMERLDAIDAIHANLERENEELRQRTMYPAESERVNMLEREVKRLTAECKTQRNNFDQATSAREHWKSLYEQALEHIHDLECDYKVACDVNERQDREYNDLANRYDNTISLPFDKDGKVWRVGDELLDDGIVCEVVGIGPNRLYYYVDATDTVEWTQADSRRHRHATTVDSVLREFTRVGIRIAAKHGIKADEFDFYADEEAISKVASKLRLAGDSE